MAQSVMDDLRLSAGHRKCDAQVIVDTAFEDEIANSKRLSSTARTILERCKARVREKIERNLQDFFTGIQEDVDPHQRGADIMTVSNLRTDLIPAAIIYVPVGTISIAADESEIVVQLNRADNGAPVETFAEVFDSNACIVNEAITSINNTIRNKLQLVGPGGVALVVEAPLSRDTFNAVVDTLCNRSDGNLFAMPLPELNQLLPETNR